MWIFYLQARAGFCLIGVLPARDLWASSSPRTCRLLLHKRSNQREAWAGGGTLQGFWLRLPLLFLVLVQPVFCVVASSLQIFTFGLRSSSSVLPCYPYHSCYPGYSCWVRASWLWIFVVSASCFCRGFPSINNQIVGRAKYHLTFRGRLPRMQLDHRALCWHSPPEPQSEWSPGWSDSKNIHGLNSGTTIYIC